MSPHAYIEDRLVEQPAIGFSRYLAGRRCWRWRKYLARTARCQQTVSRHQAPVFHGAHRERSFLLRGFAALREEIPFPGSPYLDPF